MSKLKTYRYEGQVKSFNTVLNSKYVEYTKARSEKEALANLAYQYKRKRGFSPRYNISLPGKLVLID